MKSVVTAVDLSFEHPNGHSVFKDLNLSLEIKKYGLVGPNGIGKTSLAKLLTGELDPTQGRLRKFQDILYFPQREAPPPVTIGQFLGPKQEWSLIRETLLAGLSPEPLCTTLSGGQWMRVRLAQILKENTFLILDEPTNDLDREGREALNQFLASFDGGVLLISHDREALAVCDEILELSNQGLSRFGGSWSEYLRAKELERENLHRNLHLAESRRKETQRSRQEQKIRQEKRNRQGVKDAARGGIPKILLGARKRAAQATTGKVEAETLNRADQAVSEAFDAWSKVKIDPMMYARLSFQELPSQKLVAEARDFNIRFQEWLYPTGLNFIWRGPIRLALQGRNGSGKSTLLKAILGEEFPGQGKLRRGDLATLFIDQGCKRLHDSKSVFENVRETCLRDESEIRNLLAGFLFTKDKVFQRVGELSGGERLRVALARGFLSHHRPELLILDEPTNNLDLANVQFLENLVKQFRGALLIVSHDQTFLDNCGVQEFLNLSGL